MTTHLDVQGEWDAQSLRQIWPTTPDRRFFFEQVVIVTHLLTGRGTPGGRALEVAAADAEHACNMRRHHGFETFVLEPSAAMLDAARARMLDASIDLTLTRGIAEALPYRDASFDLVLCDSAIDHFADPETGIREMARVAKPAGQVIVSFVNYAGLAPQVSRVGYAVARQLGIMPSRQERVLWWDSPVPIEHNFEATLDNVSAMALPYLEFDHAWGVSLGVGIPGWGPLLARCPRLAPALGWLDTLARRRPRLADFVIAVFRPKPRATWPVDDYRVRPVSPVYQRLIREERDYWDHLDLGVFADGIRVETRAHNEALTGNPERAWVDDLADRGPFHRAALLGCDDFPWDSVWLGRRASNRLDVYDLSAERLTRMRARLGDHDGILRSIQADLNFLRLPPDEYDVILTSDTLHYVTNLEHLLANLHRALRPGGLLAIHGWIGERRMQYDPVRLARANALLASVPARYQLAPRIGPPEKPDLTPFRGVRSDEILPLVRARFEVVHERFTRRLLPVALLLDVAALEREAPDILARVLAAEREVVTDDALQPGEVYGVYRKRAAG